ncbi:MAG TPA: aminotransferase class V-fold PLP-dependent enzyme [Nitrospira sp.]|jgi:dTDP-4-amino-4,6-dideoxygalactose transaminase|nr:aminotransferase class V-fold PLP-dependent enzyme [Nitrospira sp.]
MKAQRTLPPSAAPIDWSDLLLSLGGLLHSQAAIRRRETEFRDYFGVKHVWFVSSGKAALTLILQALHSLSGKQKVIVPGYTCFSVPSAVLRAQLDVTLCDVDPYSFDLDIDQLGRLADANVLCVLATHLLGAGVDVARIVELCRPRGIVVIEDAAQAFGGHVEGKPIGTLGDVSFLSFGRGKNLSCGSGGAVLSNDDRIAAAISREYAQLPEESVFGMLKNWFEVAATQLLIDPSVYWLPAGLPFLKLGETKFFRDFSIFKMDPVRAGLLRRWKRRLARATTSRITHAEKVMQLLSASHIQTIPTAGQGRSVFLRLPLLMRSKQQKEALCRLSDEQGLGISSMYPSSVRDIAELRTTFSSQPVPQAAMLAERLVTLPTHEFLSPHDLKRICRAIEQVHQPDGLRPACLPKAHEDQHARSELHGIN